MTIERRRLAGPAADRRRYISTTSTAELLDELYLCACLAESARSSVDVKADTSAKVVQIKVEIVRRCRR